MSHLKRAVTLLVFMVLLSSMVLMVPTGKSSAAGTASSIVDVAKSQAGVSGRPNKYTYWMGMISGSYSYSWCHAFVSWCAEESGNGDIIPKTASCSTGVNWFKNRGQWKSRGSGYIPKAGDIIYFDYASNGYGTCDHAGIVTGVSGGRVYTMEGNSSNQVKVNGGYANGYVLDNSNIMGYGIPAYQTESKPTNPRISSNQQQYDLKDTIEISVHADGSTSYYMSMFKGGNQIYGQKVDSEKITLNAADYGPGDYQVCISCINSVGSINTESLNFSIIGAPPCSHEYVENITKATFDQDGTITEKCSICDAVNKETVISRPATVSLSKTSVVYNGNVRKPSVIVTDNNGGLIAASNYKVSYNGGMKDVGCYTVTVTLKGQYYTGTVQKTFKIKPPKTDIISVKAGKNAFSLYWNMQSLQSPRYQIQYATNSGFSDATKIKVKKNAKVSKKVTGLESGKTYYVRIRTYKTITVDGKKTVLYSSWSGVKEVTTK